MVREKAEQVVHVRKIRAVKQESPFAPDIKEPGVLQLLQMKRRRRSNLYYPASDRNGVGLTFENALIGIGASAAANLLQEFVLRKFTTHVPSAAGLNTNTP